MPIYGTATFKGNSINNGEVDAAVFTESSANHGEVYSNASFTDDSSNNGIIAGDASFSGQSVNDGMVDGVADYTDDAIEPAEINWDLSHLLSETQSVDIEELPVTLGGLNDDSNIYPGGVDDPLSTPVDTFTAYSNIDPIETIPPSTDPSTDEVQRLVLEEFLNSKTFDVREVKVHSDFFLRVERENFGIYKNDAGYPALYNESDRSKISQLSRAIRIKTEITPIPKRRDFYEAMSLHVNGQVVAEGKQFKGSYVTYGAYSAKCIDLENGTVEYYNKAGELIETRMKLRDPATGKGIAGTPAWRGMNCGNLTFVSGWMDTGRGMIGCQSYKCKDIETGITSVKTDSIFASPLHAIAQVDRMFRLDPKYYTKTCTEMMKRYAEAGDNGNNPVQYAAALQRNLSNKHIDLSKVKYINLDPVSRGEILTTIYRHEKTGAGLVIPGPGKPDKIRVDLNLTGDHPTHYPLQLVDEQGYEAIPQPPENITPLPYSTLPNEEIQSILGFFPWSFFPELSTFDKQNSIDAFKKYTQMYKNTPIITPQTYGSVPTYSDGTPAYTGKQGTFCNTPTIGFSEYYTAYGDLEPGKATGDGAYVFAAQSKVANLTEDQASNTITATYESINYIVDVKRSDKYNKIREAYYNNTSLSAIAPEDPDLRDVYVASFKEISHMVPAPYYGNPNGSDVFTIQSFDAYVDVNTCCFSLYGQADLNIVARHIPDIAEYVIQPTDTIDVNATGGKAHVEIRGIAKHSVLASDGGYTEDISTQLMYDTKFGTAETGYYKPSSLYTTISNTSGVSAGEGIILASGTLLNNPSTVVGGADYVEAAALAYNTVRPHTWRRSCTNGSLIAVDRLNYFTGAVYLFGLKFNGKSNTAHSTQGSLFVPTTSQHYNIKDKYLLGVALDAQAVKMFWGTIDPTVLASLKPCIQIYCPSTKLKLVVPVVDIRNDEGIGLTYGVLKRMFPKFNTKSTDFYSSVDTFISAAEYSILIRPAHLGMTITSDDMKNYLSEKSYGKTVPLIERGDSVSRRTFQQIRRTITSGANNRLTEYISESAKETYNNKKLPSNISKVVTTVMYSATPAARVAKIVQGTLSVIRYSPEIRINAAKFFTDLRNKDAKFGLKKIWIGFKNQAIDYVADMDEIHIVESIYNTAVKIVYKKHENWSLQATVAAIRKRRADAEEGSTITGVIGSSH